MTFLEYTNSCRLTQQEIATKLGVSRATVINWRKGKRPKFDTMVKIEKLSGGKVALADWK